MPGYFPYGRTSQDRTPLLSLLLHTEPHRCLGGWLTAPVGSRCAKTRVSDTEITDLEWVSRAGAETFSGNGHPCPLIGQVNSLSSRADMLEPGRVTHSTERALRPLATGPRFTASKAWLDLLVRDQVPHRKKLKLPSG